MYSIGIYRRDRVALRLKHFRGHLSAETQTENARQCIKTESVVDLSSGWQKYFMKVFAVTHFSTNTVSVLQVKDEELRFPGFPHFLTNEFPWTDFQDKDI